jgi:predicted PolB exonuclease-like 3'-5' exonuclease
MKSLMHIDIETCGNYPTFKDFEESDPKGSYLFRQRYMKDYDDMEKAYSENAGLSSTYGKICCISFGFEKKDGVIDINSIVDKDEELLIRKLYSNLNTFSKHNFSLAGFYINHFDIPFIIHKLWKYGFELPTILEFGKKPWENSNVDLYDYYKQGDYRGRNFDEVCYELNIKSPKDEISGKDVHNKYWDNCLDEIQEYCEKDISASVKLFNKIHR